MIFDHLGYRRPTVHPVRVIEAVELLACHVLNLADRDDQSVSMEMVRTRLDCVSTHGAAVSCARRRPSWRPRRLPRRLGLAASDQRHQAARIALIAIDR